MSESKHTIKNPLCISYALVKYLPYQDNYFYLISFLYLHTRICLLIFLERKERETEEGGGKRMWVKCLSVASHILPERRSNLPPFSVQDNAAANWSTWPWLVQSPFKKEKSRTKNVQNVSLIILSGMSERGCWTIRIKLNFSPACERHFWWQRTGYSLGAGALIL